jgi:HSP20 family protein
MAYRDNLWRQFDELMSEMENRFRGGLGPGGVGDRLLPAVRGEFRVDVREDEDEVLVVADLPGVERENITARLLSPSELEISSERRSERSETGEEGQLVRQERAFGYMTRVVPLPHEVTAENSRASFTNGVLELRLKKTTVERGERIPIE